MLSSSVPDLDPVVDNELASWIRFRNYNAKLQIRNLILNLKIEKKIQKICV